MPFTLINARPSPFGRKVAIALIEKGLDYSVQYDVPWGAGTCTPDYSPLEQLPILVTDSGENIYDSVYILAWLEAKYPQPPLLPEGVDARLAAKQRQLLGERLMEVARASCSNSTAPTRAPPGSIGRRARSTACWPNLSGSIRREPPAASILATSWWRQL